MGHARAVLWALALVLSGLAVSLPDHDCHAHVTHGGALHCVPEGR